MEPEQRRPANHVDIPPFSRVFVTCSRDCKEEQIRAAFSPYGSITDIWIPKDKVTKEPKGIVYVKYEKASQAAKSLEELSGKTIEGSSKPVKVTIAQSKSSKSTEQFNESERMTRLFVMVPKETSIEDLESSFSQFGDIENAKMIKDRVTKKNKGCAFVKFYKASQAARAMEECNSSYKAVFAEPQASKWAKDLQDISKPFFDNGFYQQPLMIPDQLHNSGLNTRLYVVCSNKSTQDQLTRLFDLVPGFVSLVLRSKSDGDGKTRSFAYVQYDNYAAAIYAKEKLNMFEFPTGFRLTVKFAEDRDGQWGGGGQVRTDGAAYSGGYHYGGADRGFVGADRAYGGTDSGYGDAYRAYSGADTGHGGSDRGHRGYGGTSGQGTLDMHTELNSLRDQVSHLVNTLGAANLGNNGMGVGGSQGPRGAGYSQYGYSQPPYRAADDSPMLYGMDLGPRQKLALLSSESEERLFVSFHPAAPAQSVLEDIFCRFGNLIAVSIMRGKNCGYIQFASKESAVNAVAMLNGKNLCGVQYKVIVADPPSEARKRIKATDSNV